MRIFNETQRFNQWWMIVLLIIIVLKITYDVFTEYHQIKIGNSTKTLTSLIISLLIFGLVLILLFSIKLTTRIDEKGIYYQFFPFHFKIKKVIWEDINRCYIRKYNPILEYGGWGIRGFSRKGKGMAFNTKGNMGIQLEFKNGDKLLLGTQSAKKAALVIQNYQYKLKDNT